ncbi:protein of unknown function [Paraburkholderia kururiensis]
MHRLLGPPPGWAGGNKKSPPKRAFFVAQWKQEAARCAGLPDLLRACLQRLDGGSEAALVTSGLVLVNDLLVGNDVHRLCRCLEDLGGLGLVAGFDCLANGLDGGTELRAQRRVVRIGFGGLTGALACLCGVSHDGSLVLFPAVIAAKGPEIYRRFPCFQCPASRTSFETGDYSNKIRAVANEDCGQAWAG